MPSLFEPCGLGQLFAMSYGTIPVARATGGLVDTIKHYNYETGEGTGFLFNDYDCGGLMWGINEALNVYYNDKDRWNGIVKNAISERFSWENSAAKYIEVYKKITGKQ
jgi:starch synthase